MTTAQRMYGLVRMVIAYFTPNTVLLVLASTVMAAVPYFVRL